MTQRESSPRYPEREPSSAGTGDVVSSSLEAAARCFRELLDEHYGDLHAERYAVASIFGRASLLNEGRR